METVGGRVDSPIENNGRMTRRSKANKSITKLNGTKDQENVNNTSLVQNNVEKTVQDEVTKTTSLDEKVHASSTISNSSTPRRKKDPLANLHSNLSPKYIGFSTPPHQLNNSADERTRSLRKRHNNSNSINETTEENKDMEVDIAFTPNTEGTVGFVRRTPRNRESQITPDNNVKRKKFVSPIDKLLIKNGAVMEFKINLPLLNQDEVQLENKEAPSNGENKDELFEKELGVKQLDECDEQSENKEAPSNRENKDELFEKELGVKQLDECDEQSEDNEVSSISFKKDDEEFDKCDKISEAGEIQSSSNKNDHDKDEHNELGILDENSESNESASANIKIDDDKNEHEGTDHFHEKSESNETASISIEDKIDDEQEEDDNVSISTEIAKQIDDDNSEAGQDQNVSKAHKTSENIQIDDKTKSNEPDVDKMQSTNEAEAQSESDEAEAQYESDGAEAPSEDEDTEKAESLPLKESLVCEIADATPKVEETEDLLTDKKCNDEDTEDGVLADKTKDEDSQDRVNEIELAEDKSYHKQKTSADEAQITDSLLPGNQTAEILKVIEASKGPVIKIELESTENESNSEFVDASSATANSPSAVSLDSAKGSSIINEGSWVSFSTGDLYWGQIYNFCYWPCMVCPDPNGKTITTEEVGRSADQTVLVHVRFFADNGRRNWVKRENLMPFVGIENYQERIVEVREKYGSKSAKYKLYVPTKKKEQVWLEAVNEANIVAEVAYADRLEKFYEIFEKSKAFHKLKKQRRKSMYISVNSGTGSDIESFYGSNDNVNSIALTAAMKNKRERSISPYSPAYSPIKPVAAKRRKLSGDRDSTTSSSRRALLSNNYEENPNNAALSQTHSVASTSSNANFLSDFDLYNSLEFRKLYAYMKDYVMEQNQDDNLEKSLVVAVRNIWALRQLNRQQMERKLRNSLTENDIKPALEINNTHTAVEGSAKRLSSRLKTLMVRKSLMAQQNHESTPERSETPKSVEKDATTVEKVKKPINRPILEVIDDIFELDNKYLFKGMCREPVCKYCFKPGGNLRKCAKNCTYWLHRDCLYKDFGQKIRRGTKAFNGSKVNNESLNGSQSSSLVSLTEVGTAAHVTGDSDAPLVTADVICKECSNKEPPNCMVCNCTESKKVDDPLVKCSMAQCERSFHPGCCKYWPQAKITISKNVIESFRCPSHVCHTCVSDDPKGKFQHLSNSKLTKCVKCPATFHTDSTCIPAGSQILTAAHIICPRHLSTKLDMTVNVNWCFICVGGGQLTCCETCPTAVHAHCLKIPIDANEGYICEECESGRMPLYGEMVWAKFTNFRWWPAIILPPTEIPKNIARKTHNPSDFVVRFFGTHDHGWISRRRVYLYLEGDSSEPPKSKSSLDLSYNKGVEEAKEIYEIIKAKKIQQRNSNENKEKLHPQPYVRIKANRAVPPVKLHVDIESVNKCECDAREENPCGPDSNCLNRVLYHECNPKVCPAGERCQNQVFESRVSPRLDVVYMRERGFGLVCREPIKAGSFVIEYVGEIINDDEFQARMQQKSRDRDENFYFLSVEKDYIIDAGPKGNLARFMNHSCDPNCETQKWSVNSLNRVGLFAIRDIPENTELTFNYHWDDLLGNEKKTCYCGAKNCAGQIGAKLKDLETVKIPPSLIENGKKLSKTKPKPKSKQNKKLLNSRGLKNQLASKLKLKAKTKIITKKMTAAAVSVGLENYAKSKAGSARKTSTDESDTNEEASTSRLLESPDIFE